MRALAGIACACVSACVHAQQPAPGSAPATATSPKAKAALAALRGTIDSVVGLSQFRSAMFGALVVDPEHGDTLYSRNAGKLFVPASNQKLLTAAVALQTLGGDFRFSTRVSISGMQQDTVLTGDLVVFGSGDPSFSDRMRGDAMIPLREMADSLRARGIKRVLGRLRRGRPAFTDSPVGFGWAWDDLSATYGASVGDLMFNDAFTPVRIEFDGIRDTTPVTPPRYRNFLEAFNAALYDRGVYVQLSYDWSTPVPDSALTPLFTYQSAPLSDILPHFVKPSQNQIGEILLKTLGLRQTGAGRADSGASFVSQRLLAWGADSGGFIVHDGSGLSRHDYVSPETIVRVLDAARRDSTFPVFYAALPIAGIDGTLERRFHGTAAAGNVHAKTGSMDRVRSLSGYVTTADGHLLEFSLIANAFAVTGTEAEAALDAIVARLAAFRLQR
jgi:D-alanyl-D-alanine carboxypeptidase/D-alanyl-D-alanine-endopeptidase (penicillin-binding protein 4)